MCAMPTKKPQKTATPLATLSFDKFWTWLQAHPNCILRAGTPEAVLFDDDELHWHFGAAGDAEGDTVLVQVIRGKRLMGELLLAPADVAYVQAEPLDGEEFLFELITENASARMAAYHFVLSHAYDEEEPVTPGRWTH